MLGPVVDVVIGLVFTYLLFALLLSTLLEAAAGWFKLRAARLEQAFVQLLQDPAGGADRSVLARWLSGLGWRPSVDADPKARKAPPEETLTPEELEAATERVSGDLGPYFDLHYTDVYNHPLVGGGDRSRPSYVPAQSFASALIATLQAGASGKAWAQVEQAIDALPPGKLREALVTAANEAEGDWDAFKAGVERWYDTAMDRLSGQYKRYTQLVTFLMGLVLAVCFNVNSVTIVTRLYQDRDLRETMVRQAQTYVAQDAKAKAEAAAAADAAPDPLLEAKQKQAAFEKARSDLLANAPVGWASDLAKARTDFAAAKPAVQPSRWDWTVWFLLQVPAWLPGWLITALACMLGAPFWFDLLNKLVNVRNTGPKPESGADTPGRGK